MSFACAQLKGIEEPRVHCTSICSDSGSEDLILVPNGGMASLLGKWRLVWPSKDMSPQTIIDPPPNWSHWTLTGWTQTLSRLSHVLSVSLLSSVKNAGCQRGVCQSCCSMEDANWAARCWPVNTGLTVDIGTPSTLPPSWKMFLSHFHLHNSMWIECCFLIGQIDISEVWLSWSYIVVIMYSFLLSSVYIDLCHKWLSPVALCNMDFGGTCSLHVTMYSTTGGRYFLYGDWALHKNWSWTRAEFPLLIYSSISEGLDHKTWSQII